MRTQQCARPGRWLGLAGTLATRRGGGGCAPVARCSQAAASMSLSWYLLLSYRSWGYPGMLSLYCPAGTTVAEESDSQASSRMTAAAAGSRHSGRPEQRCGTARRGRPGAKC